MIRQLALIIRQLEKKKKKTAKKTISTYKNFANGPPACVKIPVNPFSAGRALQ